MTCSIRIGDVSRKEIEELWKLDQEIFQEEELGEEVEKLWRLELKGWVNRALRNKKRPNVVVLGARCECAPVIGYIVGEKMAEEEVYIATFWESSES